MIRFVQILSCDSAYIKGETGGVVATKLLAQAVYFGGEAEGTTIADAMRSKGGVQQHGSENARGAERRSTFRLQVQRC